MRVFVSKAVDFVFYARAVARAHAVNLAGKHRAAVKTAANDVVRACVGVGDVTRHLARMCDIAAHEAEDGHIALNTTWHPIPGLRNALAKVNCAAINARRRAGFQAALRQFEFFQPSTQ